MTLYWHVGKNLASDNVINQAAILFMCACSCCVAGIWLCASKPSPRPSISNIMQVSACELGAHRRA